MRRCQRSITVIGAAEHHLETGHRQQFKPRRLHGVPARGPLIENQNEKFCTKRTAAVRDDDDVFTEVPAIVEGLER